MGCPAKGMAFVKASLCNEAVHEGADNYRLSADHTPTVRQQVWAADPSLRVYLDSHHWVYYTALARNCVTVGIPLSQPPLVTTLVLSLLKSLHLSREGHFLVMGHLTSGR